MDLLAALKNVDRSALAGLGAREISPSCAARVLAHMARSCNSLDDAGGLQSFWGNSGSGQDANKEKSAENAVSTTWNVDVFILSLKEIVNNNSYFNNSIYRYNHWLNIKVYYNFSNLHYHGTM